MTQQTTTSPLLSVDNLVVEYIAGNKIVHAVSGVSFDIGRGETLGLVGESGCGKSTLGRAVLQLRRAVSGRVLFDGEDLTAMQGESLRKIRRRVQLIFQDPIASLNPRRRIGDIIAEPLIIAGVSDPKEREERVANVLNAVGLDPALVMGRLPHEFSGGQCQRICIARALILEPELVICDEPVSALDVSIRAQIINLLLDLKEEMSLSYIMISHDLGVVEHVSDRVAVMYLGRIVEQGGWQEIFENPRHPYTRALIAAIPDPFHLVAASATAKARGEIASALNPPPGCHFNPRCPMKADRCVSEVPTLEAVAAGHRAACHFRDRVS
jgi:peptide/nickel transport system ATP-binding protein